MSDKIVVAGVVEKKISSATKVGITWALVVDNVRYGFYKTEPKCKEGDGVEFSATQNGDFWNADAKSLKVKNVQEQPAKAAAKPMATRPWVPDKERQDTISYQAARKDSLEFVNMLISNGVLDLGKSKSAAAKIEAAEVYVDKYTQRFFEDTKNLGHVEKEPSSNKIEGEAVDPNFIEDDIPF